MTAAPRLAGAALLTTMLLAAGAAHATGPFSGVINANGTLQGSPTSFTVSHPQTGKYIITFTTAFSPFPNCIFQGIPAALQVAGLSEASNSCTVTFSSIGKKPKAADSLFNFIAVQQGP